MLKKLAVLFLLLATAALAQTRDKAAISGSVIDPSGAAVPAAQVTVTNTTTGATRAAQTDSQGRFSVPNLALTGEYTVQVSQRGFAPVTREHIRLKADDTAQLDFRLAVAAGASTVSVYGTQEGVRTDSPTLETDLGLEKINDTPIFGRKASTLPLLNSSVRPARGTGDLFLGSTLFVINGGGRRQTEYALDNATADDSWGRQSLFTSIPFSTIQEFSILTNAFSAEYGHSTGSAVNIVTKSGTNNLHGELLGMWRPSSIEAAAPLATTHVGDSLAQGSATFSGPIIKDRTFWLVSNEYTAQRRGSVITSPFAPGVYGGDFAQELFLTRLDHKLTRNNQLSLRANLDRLSDTNPQDAVGGNTLPSAARVFHRNAYAAQLSDTWVVSNSVVNEARVQFQLASPITNFTPVNMSTQFVYPGRGTIGESRFANLMNHQYEFGDTVSWVLGRHSLRFGSDVIYSSSGGYGTEFGGGFTLGQFTVKPGVTKSPDQLTAADIQRYQHSFGNLNYNVKEALIGSFIQDNVTLTQHLTVNLGLRYDVQTFTDDLNNFEPRVGFAYRLPFKEDTVLRGSYGTFVSEVRSNLAAGFKINGPEGIFSFSAAPGQLGFPTNLQPLPAFPAGAVLPPRDITVNVGDAAYLNQFFDVSKLRFYPNALLNPYTHQWSLGLERDLGAGWTLSMDYLGQHTLNIERPVDLNAPAPFVRTAPGQVRSAAAADATRPITPVPNGFRRIITNISAGQSSYNGLQVDVRKRLTRHFSTLVSYTWSHTINNVEVDVPQQDPNDSNFLGNPEKASSLLDQRHRLSVSGAYELPWHFDLGAWITAASGRPFNITTGVDNNGDGSNADRPVINGAVIPRNFGRGTATYDVSAFVQKEFGITERVRSTIRAEAFNLTNASNIVGRSGVWGNGATPQAGFGSALGGISNADPGRAFQFMFAVRF